MAALVPTLYQRSVLSLPEEINLLLEGGRGSGKLLDLFTNIPTPNGWVLLKDLKIGDRVLDEHGFPCTIRGVFDGLPGKAYRLHFSDGTHIDACADHQWVTWTLREALAEEEDFIPRDWARKPSITTQAIVDTIDDRHLIPTSDYLDQILVCWGIQHKGDRLIVKAEVIPPVPMRCLTVDSPNHMYLAGDGMIPTHNSVAIQLILLMHAERWGPLCKAIYIRETYASLQQIESDFHALVESSYGPGVVGHNKTEGMFTFPNGAVVQFGQLQDQSHYSKFQGQSFTLIVVDEYGLIKEPKWINLLFSNIRGPKKVPKRIVLAANPGGPQHGTLHYDWIAKAPAWNMYDRDGETWINCPGTYKDNPNLDQEAYLRKLKAACGNDEELFRAWQSGDWNISRGAYFAGCLDERVHMLSNQQWPIRKLTKDWIPFIGGDWGSGAPSVFFVAAESPGIDGFPKGSLILCDELATHEVNDLSVGLHWPPSKLAEGIKDLCKPWDCPPEGVGDDAMGLEESLLNVLAEYGVFLRKPKKERISGWQAMRNLLTNAKEKNGKPGLWISERCKYFWRTAPFIQRDPKRPEDVDTHGNDHGIDAARYCCLNMNQKIIQSTTTGMY